MEDARNKESKLKKLSQVVGVSFATYLVGAALYKAGVNEQNQLLTYAGLITEGVSFATCSITGMLGSIYALI